MANFNHVAR